LTVLNIVYDLAYVRTVPMYNRSIYNGLMVTVLLPFGIFVLITSKIAHDDQSATGLTVIKIFLLLSTGNFDIYALEKDNNNKGVYKYLNGIVFLLF